MGKRSSASTYRGGRKPLPEGYFRDWRADHPEYTSREAERSRQRRASYTEAVAVATPSFTDILRLLVVDELKQRTTRAFARRLFVDHTSLWRLAGGTRQPSADMTNALVTYFGLYAIHDRLRTEVRLAREAARDSARTE